LLKTLSGKRLLTSVENTVVFFSNLLWKKNSLSISANWGSGIFRGYRKYSKNNTGLFSTKLEVHFSIISDGVDERYCGPYLAVAKLRKIFCKINLKKDDQSPCEIYTRGL
jgi:hypothetical protein